MNNTNVFNCPLCKSKFSKNTKLPLTLPCGHVICKLCAITNAKKEFRCPLDNILIKDEIANLPICQTILQFLPSKQKKEQIFICKCKDKSEIQFTCMYDNEFFCENCREKHKTPVHKEIPFSPDKKSIVTEIEVLQNHAKEKYKEIQEKTKYLSDIKISLIDATKKEIQMLNSEINNIVANIVNYKNIIEEKIKEHYNNQSQEIDKLKENIGMQCNLLNQFTDNIKNLFLRLNEKNILIYSDIINEKNKIFSDWEYILKSSSTEENVTFRNLSFKFPAIRYYCKNGQYNEILSHIAFLDFVNVPKLLMHSNSQMNEQDNIIQHHQSDSTRERTRKSNQSERKKKSYSRKKSEPSTNYVESKNRLFVVDCKGDDKPVLLNDNNNYMLIVNNLKTREQKPNIKMSQKELYMKNENYNCYSNEEKNSNSNCKKEMFCNSN